MKTYIPTKELLVSVLCNIYLYRNILLKILLTVENIMEEVQIMGDKAEDMGYSRKPGRTPSWDIDVTKVEYGNPPPWFPTKVWDRELRLWACDCAERALPLWETWAKENSPEHLEDPRKAIEIARAYARGEASEEDMRKAATAAWSATDVAAAAAATATATAASDTDAWSAARAAAWSATDVAATAAWSAAASAVCFSSMVTSDEESEKQWQRNAFCERMDKVSPWAL